MNQKLKILCDLQTIDLAIAKLEKRRAALDDGSTLAREVQVLRAKAEAAEKLLHEATTDLTDKELNLKSVETKRKKFQDKLYEGSVTNAKELSNIEKEIEMLGRQKGTLEESSLVLMDLVEERSSALESIKARLADREGALSAHLKTLKAERTAIDAEIAERMPQRETARALVDPILLKRYESMRGRLGAVVSKVEAGNCSVCHTNISSGTLSDLAATEDLQTCDNCGRILFLDK
ncbi:MAG: zinc ribbon domain-containing protein [Armatimonadota bacterium]